MIQPDMAQYLLHNQRVDMFIALASLLGLILAASVIRTKPSGWRLPGLDRFRLWPLLALALLVRLPLMMQSPWYDETFSWAVINVPWSDFMTAVSGDVHPPLYYAVMKISAELFGYNIAVIRLPALIAGLLMIPAAYVIGRDYGDQRTGAVAAVLTAFLPAMVYYSTEARYPMYMALMAALAYISIKRDRPALFALFAALLGLSHATGAVYLAAFGLLALWRWRRRAILPVLISGLPLLVWIPFMLAQAGLVTDGFWLMPSFVPFRHVIEMSVSLSYGDVWVALMGVALVTAVMVAGIWSYRHRIDAAWLAVAVALPLALWLISHTIAPVYLARTLILPSVLVVIAAAWWITHQPRRWLLAAAGVAVLVALAGLYTGERATHDEVFTMCQTDQTIVATNTYTGILASYYAPGAYTWDSGDSVAQQLTDASRRVLLDVHPFATLHGNVCLVAQVSPFNNPNEMTMLQFFAVASEPRIKQDDVHRMSYYVAIDARFR